MQITSSHGSHDILCLVFLVNCLAEPNCCMAPSKGRNRCHACRVPGTGDVWGIVSRAMKEVEETAMTSSTADPISSYLVTRACSYLLVTRTPGGLYGGLYGGLHWNYVGAVCLSLTTSRVESRQSRIRHDCLNLPSFPRYLCLIFHFYTTTYMMMSYHF